MSIQFDISGSDLGKILDEHVHKMDQTAPLMRAMARTMLSRVQLGFKAGVDPYGTPWAPIHHRVGRPLMDTRTLFRSLRATATEDTAIVGVQRVPYAKRHQFGYSGPVEVPAHVRTITQAFGKSIPPKQVQVSAHTKQASTKARPFFPNAVAGMPATWINDLTNTAIRYFKV